LKGQGYRKRFPAVWWTTVEAYQSTVHCHLLSSSSYFEFTKLIALRSAMDRSFDLWQSQEVDRIHSN